MSNVKGILDRKIQTAERPKYGEVEPTIIVSPSLQILKSEGSLCVITNHPLNI